MNSDIIIWGTGFIGNIAYYYYKDKSNIICYVDRDCRKWGKSLNGIKICSPDILLNSDAQVVLALQRGINIIKEQLCCKYKVKNYILFHAGQDVYACHSEREVDEIQTDTCIVLFNGGLGNQMFQYALLRHLQILGKDVLADLSYGIGGMEFHLLNVFKNIELKVCSYEQKIELIKKNLNEKGKKIKFVLYKEENYNELNEVKRKEADISLLNITGGIISGLFQTYRYAEYIRKVLLDDFKFSADYESKLKIVAGNLSEKNSVSIHIRRGDYLIGNNVWLYGEICTDEYYGKAIRYIKEKIGDCIFCFFSNDIEWVKENYVMDNAIYIESTMFDDYQDWYDMYLMSICRNNIIANSTFSWWGAWLNQNEEKIVIAPKRWINECDYDDIYPEDWILI